jgi:glutamine amidotransferase
MPAWSDCNLSSVCRLLESKLFMAHSRASTHGETSVANCHPFVFEHWSFMHNGQIPHIARVRRALENELSDSLYNARQGTTDSELFFLLLLAMGFDDDPLLAWKKAYERIVASHRDDDEPVRMTCVLSDGNVIFAFRQSTDQNSPSLYYSRQLDNGGHALVSEPLDKLMKNWLVIPEDTFCILEENGLSHTLMHQTSASITQRFKTPNISEP